MAATHAALIRGINVGTAKRVAMADLRRLVERLGYGDVATLLNSGNVVFSASKAAAGDPAARIERAMTERLGVPARVIVLAASAVEAIVRENPLAKVASDPSRLLVTVPARPAELKGLAPLARRDWSPGALAIGRRAAWCWCPDGVSRSEAALAVGKALGDRWTARNWATMLKLRDLLAR